MMTVSAADVDAARSMAASLPESDEWLPLTSVASVLAYTATAARSEGSSEADAAELAVRLADLSPDTTRRAAGVLMALGYVAVANRLRKIAGR
jgi:hypothetical protein